jgi:Dna[CI] antecedent, DciA
MGTANLVRICPNPTQWNEVFKRLLEYADSHPCTPSRPPTPLILAVRWASNDIEKMLRWRETVDWAAANNCTAIVSTISEQDFYQVDKPSNYPIGPLGGPCYRPWDFEAKERPSSEDILKHLDDLSAHWAEIVGSSLAAVTRPLAFTGNKARRLLIQAEGSAVPPWGSWSCLSRDEAKRRTFTRIRSAINKALTPHEVDHIEFITEPL